MTNLSQQLQDWEEIQEASQMVRESTYRKRKEIINELFIPLLRDYNTKYGSYDPLNRPNGNSKAIK